MSRDSKAPSPRGPGQARASRRPSLKMQAIGFLSRREHSRQELRTKLLESLRRRAREDVALAAAAEELARAAQAQPSNGIDDAFSPRDSARAPARLHVPPAGDDSSKCARAGGRMSSARSALDQLALASGAALPSRLRASLQAIGNPPPGGQAPAAFAAATCITAEADDGPEDIDLERTDPEAAVDQLLDWLVANKYLSETRFVESRVNARSRKQGALLIKLELSRHGLALEPEQATQLRETEFSRAQALWQRKFGEVAPDARLRARQARFLAARGFAADIVRRIVGGEEEF